MSEPASPTRNRLLATLPAESQARILPRLRVMNLPRGTVIHEAGQVQELVYFPVSCCVSLLYLTASGSSTEVAIIGREGMVGLAALMGGRSMVAQSVVECRGVAFSLPAPVLMSEFKTHAETKIRLLLYVQAQLTQVSQLAVCNRHHSIEQQLCRRLLFSLDSQPDTRIKMTQGLIANLLGVRREGVTEAACRLRQLGVISYHRGEITVLDRPRLEQLSCECYQVVRHEYDRLLSRRMASPRVTRHLMQPRRGEDSSYAGL